MRRLPFRWMVPVLVLGAGLSCVGCAADKLTHDRYELVRQDVSTKAEVTELLGPPTSQFANDWHYERHDRGLTVLLEFDDAGKVRRKQWIDAGTGEWHDSNDK